MKISKILKACVEGPDTLLKFVNMNDEILYDVVIPKIFHYLYNIEIEEEIVPREISLLKEHLGSGYYEFNADPQLVCQVTDPQFADFVDKSFHADTYCFDSRPEKEVFMQYLQNEDIDEIYFTGMFTSGQCELLIPYYDSESQSLRTYYPDFFAVTSDGVQEIIEVKGENKLDDQNVKDKKVAAEATALGSQYVYKIIPGNFAMNNDIFEGAVEQDNLGID